MPYVLEYSKPNCGPRLAQLARECGIGPQGGTDEQLADAFIAKICSLKQEFSIPERLDALRAEDIPPIATAALAEARFTYAVPRYMDKKTCENLIRQMLVA